MFKCECGKEFDNSQSYNGHKSHCKEHYLSKYGSLDKWEANKLAITQRIKLGGQKYQQKLLSTKKTTNQAWVAEQHRCERCGEIMTQKFGSGRFCSRTCANSRPQSEETKEKLSKSLSGRVSPFKGICKNTLERLPVKTCKICGKALTSYNKTGFCAYCLSNTDEGKQARKKAGQKGYQTMLANGTHKSWQSRNITSFAEQFWINVLNNYNITYIREFPIKHENSNYFLDFKLERHNKLIDLEIDGKQHAYEERVVSDKIRDDYLKSLGYIVYRISWNDLKTDTGKQEMQGKIDKFLDFYNAL